MAMKATECDLVLILEELNFDVPLEHDDYGTIKSWCCFYIEGTDMSIKKILDVSPLLIRQTICDLLTANMLEVWHGNAMYTELPARVDDLQFKVCAVLSPLEFVEFLVNNPIYGHQAKWCVRERLNEYQI